MQNAEHKVNISRCKSDRACLAIAKWSERTRGIRTAHIEHIVLDALNIYALKMSMNGFIQVEEAQNVK